MAQLPSTQVPSAFDSAQWRSNPLLDDLHWRGLIASSTDLDALARELEQGPATFYCGFDPTAQSLHVGHLAQTLTARRFQLAGHRPLALVGGATGLIGDPKPTSERTLNEAFVVNEWSVSINNQLARFFDFDGPAAARMVNNYEWTAPLSVIDFLRDIGKHFSVNRMLDREAVARRLADQGISFTEFSYVLLQAMDYLELFRRYDCRLQTGGSDQFGNIVAGVDLVRRATGGHVHGLTTPLMTKADGTKFGKTDSGAIWLDPALTSPYAFYQFWLNSDDRDISRFLRMFSFASREEIHALEVELIERPSARSAQRALAAELTTLVHGSQSCESVQEASKALFGGGDLRAVPESTLTAALEESGGGVIEIPVDASVGIIDLLVAGGLANSRGAARRVAAEGGASVNNRRVADEHETFELGDCLPGQWFAVRRGRRAVAGVRIRVA